MIGTRAPLAKLAVALLLGCSVAFAAETPKPIAPNPLVVDLLKVELRYKGLTAGSPVFFRVYKEEGAPQSDLIPTGKGHLQLWMEKDGKFVLFKTFEINNFSGKLGPKLKEGDLQAIEGVYTILPTALNNDTKFHLSLNTGYPNEFDQDHGRTGSYILIHGRGKSVGCFAFSDTDIDQIFYLVQEAFKQNAQPAVQLYSMPFPMTDENLAQAPTAELKAFWDEIAIADRYFEQNHVPAVTKIEQGEYVFYDQDGNVLPAVD